MENSTLFEKQAHPRYPANNDKKKKNLIGFAVILLLLITNILLLVKVLENDKKVHQQEKIIVSTRIEKDALLSQLKEERAHFERIKSENTGLNRRLSERDREIKAKMQQIEKLINSGDEAQLKKAKEELGRLRKLSDQYIAQIALLKRENKELVTQNTTLNESLNEEKSKTQDLLRENTSLAAKVALGAVLKTRLLSAKVVRYRSSGKEVEVEKASRAEKVKVCFTILENPIATKGNITVYLRIIGPDGATISSSNETINYRGTLVAYTLKQEVMYENRETGVCFLWAKGTPYAAGDYTAELYSGGQQIGVTKFTLR
jgi:hypothetical protein